MEWERGIRHAFQGEWILYGIIYLYTHGMLHMGYIYIYGILWDTLGYYIYIYVVYGNTICYYMGCSLGDWDTLGYYTHFATRDSTIRRFILSVHEVI